MENIVLPCRIIRYREHTGKRVFIVILQYWSILTVTVWYKLCDLLRIAVERRLKEFIGNFQWFWHLCPILIAYGTCKLLRHLVIWDCYFICFWIKCQITKMHKECQYIILRVECNHIVIEGRRINLLLFPCEKLYYSISKTIIISENKLFKCFVVLSWSPVILESSSCKCFYNRFRVIYRFTVNRISVIPTLNFVEIFFVLFAKLSYFFFSKACKLLYRSCICHGNFSKHIECWVLAVFFYGQYSGHVCKCYIALIFEYAP